MSKESIGACIARVERNGGTAMAAPGDVTDEETVKGTAGVCAYAFHKGGVNSFTPTAPNPAVPPATRNGGARARNFAHIPAAAADLAGPLPLITLDSTPMPEGFGPF